MREFRISDLVDKAIDDALSNMHTSTVAKITKVQEKTIWCKPVLNRLIDGESVELPEFIDVPIINISGGSSYIAMPLAAGDSVLLIFTERCFDSWYNGQDYVAPSEYRMHDYSDGFALVGIHPRDKEIAIPQVITINGDLEINGNVQINGDVTCTGIMTASDFVANGKSLKDHTHTDSQGGNTTPPN